MTVYPDGRFNASMCFYRDSSPWISPMGKSSSEAVPVDGDSEGTMDANQVKYMLSMLDFGKVYEGFGIFRPFLLQHYDRSRAGISRTMYRKLLREFYDDFVGKKVVKPSYFTKATISDGWKTVAFR